MFSRQHLPITLYYLAILVAGIMIVTAQSPAPPGGVHLRDALFRPLLAPDLPAEMPEARVSLPHSMDVPGAGRFGGGIYRLEFPYGRDEAETWSVLIPRYSGRIHVRVNDVLLYDSEWTHSGLIASLTWPDIIPIPAPLLKDGANSIEIRTAMLVGIKSYLSQIHVGPDSALRPSYRSQYFLLVMLPQLLFACQMIFGLLLIIVWAVRRSELAFLLFTIILFINAGGKLVFLISGPAVPAWVMLLSNFSFAWVAALLIPFALSFTGRRLPPASFLPLIVPVIASIGFFVLPQGAMIPFNWIVMIPSAVIMLCFTAFILLDAAIRHGNRGAHVVSGGALLALFMACHDLPMLYGSGGERLFTNPNAVPVLLLLMVTGIVLMWRFAVALNEVDRFNLHLRREIAAAEAALRTSLTREQAQKQAIALEGERSRLTRDLHDGIAGQLVSMVALSGRPEAKPKDFGAAARNALADLRLVIASMAEVGSDPGMMLANFRDHIEPQLRALGVTLDWRMHALPEASGWSSSTALEMFRLLQEATINAARHSGAGQVMIEISPTDDGVRVVVADKGRGGATDRPGGYGLANMRRRARTIGGRLAIASGPAGTSVTLDLSRQSGPAAA